MENITYSFIDCKEEGERCRRGECCGGLMCGRKRPRRCIKKPGNGFSYKCKDSFLKIFLHIFVIIISFHKIHVTLQIPWQQPHHLPRHHQVHSRCLSFYSWLLPYKPVYSKNFSNILECTKDEHCIDDPTGDTCKGGKCVCGLCGCKCDKPAICIDGKCQLPPTGKWWPK